MYKTDLTPPLLQVPDLLIGLLLAWVGAFGLQPLRNNNIVFLIAILLKCTIFLCGILCVISGMRWSVSVRISASAGSIVVDYWLLGFIPVRHISASKVEIVTTRQRRPFSGSFKGIVLRFKGADGRTRCAMHSTLPDALTVVELCREPGIPVDGVDQLGVE